MGATDRCYGSVCCPSRARTWRCRRHLSTPRCVASPSGSSSRPMPTDWSMSAATLRRGRRPRRCWRWHGHDPASCRDACARRCPTPDAEAVVVIAPGWNGRRARCPMTYSSSVPSSSRSASAARAVSTSTVANCSYRTSTRRAVIVDLTGVDAVRRAGATSPTTPRRHGGSTSATATSPAAACGPVSSC